MKKLILFITIILGMIVIACSSPSQRAALSAADKAAKETNEKILANNPSVLADSTVIDTFYIVNRITGERIQFIVRDASDLDITYPNNYKITNK